MSHSVEQLQRALDNERKTFAVIKVAGIAALCMVLGSVVLTALYNWTLFSVAAIDAIIVTAFACLPGNYISALRYSHRFLIERSQFRDDQAEWLQLTDGTIRYWNKGAQELYGFSSEEAIGRKSHELLKTQFPTALEENLLANALKFRSAEKPIIHVSANRHEDGWQFAIKDNRLGLEMQHAERIFLIFQRLHRKEDYPGSGFGLAVCRRIVNRHGGRIWAESLPGKGTPFYFTIPAMVDGALNKS